MGSLGSFPYDGSVSRVRVRGAHKSINPGAQRAKRANPRIAIQIVSPRSGRQRKAWGVSPRITIGIIPPAREAGDGLKGDSHVRLLHEPSLLHSVVTKDRRPLIPPDYEVRLYDYHRWNDSLARWNLFVVER